MFYNLKSLFPLIDDPANIFYSRLKTLLLSLLSIHPQIERKDRNRYKISLEFNNRHNSSTIIDLRKYEEQYRENLPNLTYLYLKLKVTTVWSTSIEKTISGQSIPVKEQKVSIAGITSFSKLVSSESTLLDEESVLIEDFDNPATRKVFLLIGSIEKLYNDDDTLFLVPSYKYTDLPKSRNFPVNYNTIYRPDVGRKWVINKNDKSWTLFSLDSDRREILIDSSSYTFSYLPAQESPYIDHPLSLACIIEEDDSQVSISLAEPSFFYKTPSRWFIKLRNLSEYALNSNHSPNRVSWLISNLRFVTYRSGNGKSFNLSKELTILAISYILGVNIRFFISPRSEGMFSSYYSSLDSSYGSNKTLVPTWVTETTLFQNSFSLLYPTLDQDNVVQAVDSTYSRSPVMQNYLLSDRHPVGREKEYNKVFIEQVRKAIWHEVTETNNRKSPFQIQTNHLGTDPTLGDLINNVYSLTLPDNIFSLSYLGNH